MGFYTAVASVSDKIRSDQRHLLEQLETFSIEAADIKVQSDKDKILQEIRDLFHGGINTFNELVRGALREEVSDEFCAQRAMVSYHLALVASPALGFILVTFLSSYGPQPWEFQVTYAICIVTALFGLLPLGIALSLSLSRKLTPRPVEFTAPAAWWGPFVSINRYHVVTGLIMWVANASTLLFCIYLPGRMALGKGLFGFFNTFIKPWHGLLLEVCFSMEIFCLTWLVFGKRKDTERLLSKFRLSFV